MKKQKNHSQLKDQENSPERTNSEILCFTVLPDPEFKKEAIKMLKKSRKVTNKNAHPYNKKLKTTNRDQLKLEN